MFDRLFGSRRSGPGWLLPVALVGAIAVGLLGATVVSANDAPAECAVSGSSLGEARRSYADNCSLPRIDCDEIEDVWYCSSRVIGKAAPGGVTADDVGASGIGNDGTLVITVPPPPTEPPSTEPSTTEPPVTEPPVTEPPTTQPPGTEAPTTTAPAPTTTAAPPPNPTGECGVVAIEAETLALNGAWSVVQDDTASDGRYITWEGLSKSANNNQPADVISATIEIDKPGSYRFTWAMRQPNDVESDKANDSWLNFPDADRFGPVGGGSYPGFIKVYGNSTGGFSYRATADVNHDKSPIAVGFDSAGTYTLQIAGRSHGHQIDRIVIHHESIGQSDAIAGRGTGCGGEPPTTPAPTPSTAPSPTTTAPAPPTTERPTGTCLANTSGEANLNEDLISLHYDHAPDRDDAHASAAGREVAIDLEFTPWVIGGAYGADNARSYRSETEPIMDAIWGPSNWVNADADWDGAVRRTADRWQRTLNGCGDIWIAEGGQSDLSADVVRTLKNRMPNLDTERRIHLVQHSNWNEEKALDADLAYVKANTDYIRISDGNGGGNGTAGFNDRNYDGPFIAAALNGPNAAGWRAAFDYYPPRSERLDFSDTVELMEILDIGTDRVSDIQDFVDMFMS